MFWRPIHFRHVIKELVHAFSRGYIELWMHLGSWEIAQETRVTLGYLLEQILRFFHALQTSHVHPQFDIRTLGMNQFFFSRSWESDTDLIVFWCKED